MPPETTHAERRVHILGAGPVGLMLTALLQTTGTFSIRLYEKRREYTRTRMVKLDSYLVADSVENYCIDHIDGENLEAVFDRTELDEGLAFRRSIPSDLKALLRNWTLGFCPIRGKGENHQHWMGLEPKNGNRERERQRNEADYEKHGCRLLARLPGDLGLAA
jgi:hypothetical protein